LKIGIVPNAERDAEYAYTHEVCAFLQARGHQPQLRPAAAFAAGMPDAAAPDDIFYRESAFLTVLGGDGTMLGVSHYAAPYGAVQLGINLGNLGFLTDAEQSDGLAALERALNGKGKHEHRLMLRMEGPSRSKLSVPEQLALNEICLYRGGYGKLVHFQLYINGFLVDKLRADGIIIATPTGSTAYNLAAGGPILSPDGDFLVITPVCPHALHARPWVINARDTVEIRIANDVSDNAVVSVDGERRMTLKKGERLTVRRAEFTACILRTSGKNFYQILRKKMMGTDRIDESQTPG
jgi:NAD+ kinase